MAMLTSGFLITSTLLLWLKLNSTWWVLIAAEKEEEREIRIKNTIELHDLEWPQQFSSDKGQFYEEKKGKLYCKSTEHQGKCCGGHGFINVHSLFVDNIKWPTVLVCDENENCAILRDRKSTR